MNRTGQRVLSALAVTVLLGGPCFAPAEPEVGRYRVIIERNPFDLQPPPPPPVDDPPAPPAVDIKLTGVASLSARRVFLRVLETNRLEPFYYTLKEGERAGELEVIAVDVKTGRVRIRHRGQPMLLTFETHGQKPPVMVARTTRVGAPVQPEPSEVTISRRILPASSGDGADSP